MYQMKYKIIVTDLDGTLLGSDNHIDSATINYLIDFQKNGGIVVLASGRHYRECLNYMLELRFSEYKNNGYCITCDGQYIYDCLGNLIFEQPYLNGIDIANILKYIDLQLFNVSAFSNESNYRITNGINIVDLCSYYIKKSLNLNILFKNINIRRNEYLNLDKIEKIRIECCTKKDSLKILAKKDIFKYYETVYLKDNTIEIHHLSVNKLTALLYLVDKLKISHDVVIVFGDEGNDISMLKYFKNSFAMSNASQTVKESAKNVTSSNNEQGVLLALTGNNN
jgi:Cof subfamily protein (haloacid dehalogenase superfamily)